MQPQLLQLQSTLEHWELVSFMKMVLLLKPPECSREDSAPLETQLTSMQLPEGLMFCKCSIVLQLLLSPLEPSAVHVDFADAVSNHLQLMPPELPQ